MKPQAVNGVSNGVLLCIEVCKQVCGGVNGQFEGVNRLLRGWGAHGWPCNAVFVSPKKSELITP